MKQRRNRELARNIALNTDDHTYSSSVRLNAVVSVKQRI